MGTLREQLAGEATRHRECQESANCRIRQEEAQKCTLEERLDKATNELQATRAEHMTLGEFLIRLARAMCWSECAEPPTHGADTAILADSLLERAERLAVHHEHHSHANCEKNCLDHHGGHGHHNHHHLPKLRRERSCHDLPLKEVIACLHNKKYIEQFKHLCGFLIILELCHVLVTTKSTCFEGTSATT